METPLSGMLNLLVGGVVVVIVLVVVGALLRLMLRAQPRATPAELGAGVADQTRAQAHALVTQGQPAQAVALLQNLAGLSHSEAQAYVNSITAAIASGPPPAGADTADALAEVRVLLARGNKIAAIKRYREQYDVGLKEAKDAVEALGRGQPLPTPPTRPRPPVDQEAGMAEVRALLARGNKIGAIKRYRELSGVGLKEAKDYVDALEARG